MSVEGMEDPNPHGSTDRSINSSLLKQNQALAKQVHLYQIISGVGAAALLAVGANGLAPYLSWTPAGKKSIAQAAESKANARMADATAMEKLLSCDRLLTASITDSRTGAENELDARRIRDIIRQYISDLASGERNEKDFTLRQLNELCTVSLILSDRLQQPRSEDKLSLTAPEAPERSPVLDLESANDNQNSREAVEAEASLTVQWPQLDQLWGTDEYSATIRVLNSAEVNHALSHNHLLALSKVDPSTKGADRNGSPVDFSEDESDELRNFIASLQASAFAGEVPPSQGSVVMPLLLLEVRDSDGRVVVGHVPRYSSQRVESGIMFAELFDSEVIHDGGRQFIMWKRHLFWRESPSANWLPFVGEEDPAPASFPPR